MFERRLPEGQGQNLALTVLYVPWLSYMCHACLVCAGTTSQAPASEQTGNTFTCFNDVDLMAKARKTTPPSLRRQERGQKTISPLS